MEAERQRELDRNDQARAAYGEARTLFKQVEDRLGEANVLLGLGELERKLGRNDQARAAYGEARTFYKQEQHRLGEANVLWGLGHLEAQKDAEAAKKFFYQAAHIYESLEMKDEAEEALGEAKKLGR
ncbi:MAG: tetratricopeptide repeat protein [Proteobacteria bacterium]|nr:tetratricopeptide repeat protein [Pseudomonadota bacterium]